MKRIRTAKAALTLAFVCASIGLSVAIKRTTGPARPEEAGDSLVISPTVQELGEVPKGEIRLVRLHVANVSRDREAHVIGATNTCGPLGCIRVVGLPITIPAGRSVPIEIEYEGVNLGRSARVARIFTDQPGQADIPFTIVADIVAPGQPWAEKGETP